MKKTILILSLFIPLATTAIILFYLYNLYKNIDITYRVSDLSFKNIKDKKIDLTLDVFIGNKSDTSIKANSVSLVISYKGKEVATSSNI
jgi:Na+-transporting methylmalonyl-CoA/oxaloacetate decarboxylase beta subunit